MFSRNISSRARVFRIAGLVLGSTVLPGLAAASLAVVTPEAPISHAARLASMTTTMGPRAVKPSAPCPSNMAHVGKSCVDKFEASLVEIHEDGSETSFSAHEAPNGHNVRAVSRPNVVPQAHVSMIEAKRACKASGKRLCHAGEWKAACKGPESTRYPYGNKRIANACVDTNRVSPMRKLYSDRAWAMNDPRANQLPGTVEKTGTATACTNDYGVDDMVGNVHEWTDDGSFRGGYYLDTKLNGEGCDYRTTAHAASYYDYSTGFRCCADENSVTDEPDLN